MMEVVGLWGFGKSMSSAEEIAVLWRQYYVDHNVGLTSICLSFPVEGIMMCGDLNQLSECVRFP